MGRIYPRSIIFVDSQIKRDSKLVNWVKFWHNSGTKIFDKSNPLHFDSAEIEKIWEMIAENLDTTAQVCKERWRLLVSAYERYKDGYLTIHEALYQQLEECLNIVCNDIKQRAKEKQIKDSRNEFSQITEEVQSFSLISQQFGHFFPRDSQGGDDDVSTGAMSLPLTDMNFEIPQSYANFNILDGNLTVLNEIVQTMSTQILTKVESSSSIESPVLDITQEEHTSLFLEKCERSI